MKRISLLAGVFIVTATACNTPSARQNGPETTTPDESIQTAKDKEDRSLSPAARQARDEGALWFVSGNEPGWSVVLYSPEKGAVLHTSYGTETYVFDRYEKNDRDDYITFVATSTNHTFTLRLVKELCTDDAGQDFPYSSQIHFLGCTWRGCALPLNR